jgi:AcrR family transcriptional regulator
MNNARRAATASRKASRGAGRRVGRPAGDSGTREAILDAARTLFAERGYNTATIRAIAASAGVDPALVHHYYGTKEKLFVAAMQLPVVPSEVIGAALAPDARPDGTGLGEHVVRTALTLWESPGLMETFLGLFRSAVADEQAAVMLREFIAGSILSTMGHAVGLDRLPPAESQYRAGLVASQMVGLAVTRLVLRFPPVTNASVDDLARAIGPAVERYLTGDIAAPAPGAARPRAGERTGR